MTEPEETASASAPPPMLLRRVRAPVRRQGARFYMLLTLLSFAGSVALTRLFLELTGYPQLAAGDLHIAHVLWGGLLLFVASLLPLIFANRWVYTVSSLAAGVGVGLFIDEVGKFITQTNDYFYPGAAPIVYAVFLITAAIYLQARRPHARAARSELYQALEMMEEVLDRDLQPEELADLKARLSLVAHDPVERDLARLAGELMRYLDSQETETQPHRAGWWDRVWLTILALDHRLVTRWRWRALLLGSYMALGVLGSGSLLEAGASFLQRNGLWPVLDWLFRPLLQGSDPVVTAALVRIGLEAAVGLTFLLSGLLLILGQEKGAINLATYALLLTLTVVNLVVFYYEQFSAIVPALVESVLLTATIGYRQRYLSPAGADPH
jgi:hypothetical protein